MSDDVEIEELGPERAAELHAEQLRALQQDIEAMQLEINRHEFREMLQSLDNPLTVHFDAALSLMRRRLAQSRAKLVTILGSMVIPGGMGDPGLESSAAPKDRALLAVKELITAAARARALPVEDPLVSEEEVEEEYERQLGDGRPGPGQTRRGGVRPR